MIRTSEAQFVKVATVLAVVLAICVAVVLPGAYYFLVTTYWSGKLETEAQMQSFIISKLISENPTLWRFEGERLAFLLERSNLGDNTPRIKTVLDQDGRIVLNNGDPAAAPPPYLEQDAGLFDSGHPTGTIVIKRSLRPLLGELLLVGACSSLLAISTFYALRNVPLRMLQRAWGKITFLATHDSLTRLPNRTLFLERLEQCVTRARSGMSGFALFYLDLDHFKEVNDSLGHPAGDRLLELTAVRLTSCLRQEDFVARLSGDEFAIIQSNVSRPENAESLAKRVKQSLSAGFDLDGRPASVGTSIGIAIYDSPGINSSELRRRADLALYRAKREERGGWAFYSDFMGKQYRARIVLEADLRRALDDGQFLLHYQPQVDLATGKIQGVEALIRWRHPIRGMIPPAEFIPLAEETGLILPLGEWVLSTSCHQAAMWPHLKLAVNISAMQFQRGNLAATVGSHLSRSGLRPECLELEMTESVLLEHASATIRTLQRLKDIGVGIAMDDFGTGYSSLSYLHRFPFNKLKIDRSFVRDLGRVDQATAVVRGIVGLGHSLGMRINAEGIETHEQAHYLRLEGCDEGQGFLYGRPMLAEDVDILLRRPTVIELTAAQAG